MYECERNQYAYIVTSEIKIFCLVVALMVGCGVGSNLAVHVVC